MLEQVENIVKKYAVTTTTARDEYTQAVDGIRQHFLAVKTTIERAYDGAIKYFLSQQYQYEDQAAQKNIEAAKVLRDKMLLAAKRAFDMDAEPAWQKLVASLEKAAKECQRDLDKLKVPSTVQRKPL
jgi:hypothetical protein